MQLGELVIKLFGIIFVIVGACLILSVVGLNLFGISLAPWWAAILVGVILVGAGIYIYRGGTVSL